jgi:3-phosphoglycerate kinase
MQAELEALANALENPQRPLTAIVGGAKISTKLDLLGNLLDKVNALIIGGAMANTFLLAQGKTVGKSLAEPDLVPTARKIMDKAKSEKREIILPVDVVTAAKLEANASSRVLDADKVGGTDMILDIGPRSIEQVVSVLARAKTLVWNGPFRRVRGGTVRQWHHRSRGSRCGTDRGRQTCLGSGRWRYRRRTQCCRGRRSADLRLGSRRCISRMA